MDAEVRRRVRIWLRDHDEAITVGAGETIGCPERALRHLGAADGELRRVAPNTYVDAVRGGGLRTGLRVALCLGGPGALASHQSAAALLGLVDDAPARPSITVAHSRCTQALERAGVVTHRTRHLPPPTWRSGFPATSPTRTLIDLAPGLTDDRLNRLLDQAFERQLLTTSSLQRDLDRWRRPGTGALRRCLAQRLGLDVPGQSALETMTNGLIADLHRQRGVPLPVREYSPPGERIRFDYAWPDVLLAAEVDGFAWHSRPRHLTRDNDRRNGMVVDDWGVLVFTWERVQDDRDAVADLIATAYWKRLAKARSALRR